MSSKLNLTNECLGPTSICLCQLIGRPRQSKPLLHVLLFMWMMSFINHTPCYIWLVTFSGGIYTKQYNMDMGTINTVFRLGRLGPNLLRYLLNIINLVVVFGYSPFPVKLQRDHSTIFTGWVALLKSDLYMKVPLGVTAAPTSAMVGSYKLDKMWTVCP